MGRTSATRRSSRCSFATTSAGGRARSSPASSTASSSRISSTASAYSAAYNAHLPFAHLDNFKRINDTQGHLRGAIRERDVVDEFFLVLPDADAQAAEAVAQRVTDAVAAVGRKFDPAKPVTASTGIGQARQNDSVASLTRRADDAAYRAKAAGGNRVIAA